MMSDDKNTDPVGLELEEVRMEEAAKDAPVEEKPDDAAALTKENNVNETQMPLFIVFYASIVLMIATGTNYEWNITNIGGYAAYAISIPSVGIICSCNGLLLAKFAEDTYSKVGAELNMLCFLYCFIGVCFLTFVEPFVVTSNGYFAAWTVVYGSAMSMDMTGVTLGSTIKSLGHGKVGLFASSVVVLIASIAPIQDDANSTDGIIAFFESINPSKLENHSSEALFALVVACVTAVCILSVVGLDKMDKCMPSMVNYLIFVFLAICWIVMASFVTFRGPFEVTGNGYFASWAGAMFAIMSAFAAKEVVGAEPSREVGVEDAPAPEPTVRMDKKELPLFIVFIASIVLMIATGMSYDWNIMETGGYAGYAISISSVGMIHSFVGLVNTNTGDMYSKVGMRLNMLCFMYIFIGVCFLTFDKPFVGTSNGYFAAWVMVYGSAKTIDLTTDALFDTTIKEAGLHMILFVSSLVVLIAAIPFVGDEKSDEAIFALVVSCITIAFVLIAITLDNKEKPMRVQDHTVALFNLSILWIVMACFVTFRGPFEVTGNGYFASWAGALAATMASVSTMRSVEMM